MTQHRYIRPTRFAKACVHLFPTTGGKLPKHCTWHVKYVLKPACAGKAYCLGHALCSWVWAAGGSSGAASAAYAVKRVAGRGLDTRSSSTKLYLISSITSHEAQLVPASLRCLYK
jgi:hypothetical protein